MGFYASGSQTRLMFELVPFSIYLLVIYILLFYYNNNNEWLLSINSIYNEIRNKKIDERLQELAEKLSKRMHRINKIIVWFTITTIFVIWTIRWEYLLTALFGYLSSALISILDTTISAPLILREMFICFFICFKYKILFRVLNRGLSRITVRNKNRLLSVHNRLCYSVFKANEYLGTVLIILITFLSPMCCYGIYLMVFSQFNSLMSICLMAIILSFVLILIALWFSIAYIDVEAKSGLHFVYGLGLKFKSKDQINDVNFILKNKI